MTNIKTEAPYHTGRRRSCGNRRRKRASNRRRKKRRTRRTRRTRRKRRRERSRSMHRMNVRQADLNVAQDLLDSNAMSVE